MTARRAPKIPASDMAPVVKESAPNLANLQEVIGTWEPASAEDRDLLLAAFRRNDALDLADALGLLDEPRTARRLTSDGGPKTVPCPKCGVAAGQPCRTSTSGVLGGYHTARQEAA